MGFFRSLSFGMQLLAVIVLLLSFYLSRVPKYRGLLTFLVQENNFNYTAIPSLIDKVALVTGANSGLGLSTASALAENGAKVIMTCRSMPKCETAANAIRETTPDASLVLIVADLNDLLSVQTGADQIIAQTDQINVLILNAGVAFAEYNMSKQGLETHFAVNHVAHFYLTSKLTPLLRQSAPATVAVVSSGALEVLYPHKMAQTEKQLNDKAIYETFKAYGQSKIANLYFGQEYTAGIVATNIAHLFLDRMLKYGVPTALVNGVVDLLPYIIFDSKTAALTQLYAAVSPHIIDDNISGKFFAPIGDQIDAGTLEPAANNMTLQKSLWTLTESLLKDRGLNDY